MKKIIVCDFETNNTKTPNIRSWCFYNPYEKINLKTDLYEIKDNYIYGFNFKGFFSYMRTFKYDYIIYFHNGAKFDNHFILPNFPYGNFKQGNFSYNNKIIEELKISDYKELKTSDTKWIKPNEYSILADGNKKILQIKICLPTKKRSGKNRMVIINDSNLLFTNSLKNYGKLLNKTFNTTKYKKLDEGYDYSKVYNYKNIDSLINDKQELIYLKRDVFILFSFLELMSSKLPSHNWKITQGATTYNEWIKSLGEKLLEQDDNIEKMQSAKSSKENPIYFYRYKNKEDRWKKNTTMIKQQINKLLPTYWLDYETDYDLGYSTYNSQYLKNWYYGGLTLVNHNYKGLILKDMLYADINSSYPSIMNSNLLFPIGVPKLGDGGLEYPLKLFRVLLNKNIKNHKGLPFIWSKLKPNLKNYSRQYSTTLKQDDYIYLTSVEYIRFKKYYNFKDSDIEKECMYSFKATKGKELFNSFIDHWYKEKKQAKINKDYGYELIAKLFLNCLYGKFGTKTNMISSIYNDLDKEWEKEESIVEANFYYPISIFITAYARMKLVDAVGYNYEHFIYCDTDSLIFKQKYLKDFNLKIDNELGNWKIEDRNLKGIVRRAKQYYFYNTKDGSFKHALASFQVKDNNAFKTMIKDFIYGADYEKQIIPHKFISGIFLEEDKKTLKPIWEYDEQADDWFNSEKTYFKNYDAQYNKMFRKDL